MDLLLLIAIVLAIAWQRKTSHRLARVEDELLAMRQRIDTLTSTAPPDAAIAETEAETLAPPAEDTAEAAADAAVAIAAREDAVHDLKPLNDKAETSDTLESNLGARWAVWVGGVALALGGIFLIRYSIESGLIGPETRLILAGVFGLLLIGTGEAIRRRMIEPIADRYGNAMIPGALTAAGAITLLGATYAAHGYYGFIGATPAFVLLGVISLGTVSLSLLHGQALAGLGLAGSLVTPALVSTTAPSPWVLFTFLAVTWLASAGAARLRRWTLVPVLANLGLGGWVLAYLFEAFTPDITPPTLALLVAIAGTGFIWPGHRTVEPPASTETWWRFLRRPPLGITLSLSLVLLLAALAMLAVDEGYSIMPIFAAASLVAALAALGAGRSYAVWPTLLSAVGAVACISLMALILLDQTPVPVTEGGTAPPLSFGLEIAISLGLGGVFTFLGFAFLRRTGTLEPKLGALWALSMSAVPVALATISFLNFGTLAADWIHGLYGLALGAILLGIAQWRILRSEAGEADRAANLVALGSFAGLAFALHALTTGITTTILIAVIGFAYVLATRWRPWPAFPWAMGAAIVVVFARIAWEPTLVGANQLGTTPFWNALLPGYVIPALLAVLAAYQLRNWQDHRARNFLQAVAALMGMMALVVLVRHAMNGGVLDDSVATLGEQSIYTLLTIGLSATLMTLDTRAPSPVFRYGSMIAGVLATANVLSLHVFVLNPYLSGESTGAWPFVNLLLIGYLLPALSYAGLAYYARDKRPRLYVMMLALAGALLGFLWATLSVRRFWHGENIADWKGFLQNETYTYSVVWLLIGVALLVLGSRLDARSLRLASAGLVIITVLKVFLIDMSNLEGILRALSFIGLGIVLMGIGLFYQRILARRPSSPPELPPVPEAKA
ncbi:hypothetical protein RHAB21_01349 [Pseudorhizobium halotolerans]|uniref:Membrane protein DUF2339 n=1 Tax=Pseudorhizobium halotolerans TaxID=1233081 RepID=A0ABN7JGN7_9HYPH|nr:DUF2339 domain-containing protein [Pseudorhizobium halotolerans]CAD7027182.1 hypothetical protein RHAB21_01349 [Pseudorhizobium halotolerans]